MHGIRVIRVISGRIERNLVDSLQFEGSISRCSNRKMVSEFRVICQNGGNLKTLGGYKDFWYIVNNANGADFATFTF